MPLPNLIVIGAMKSGTTSLHDYLNQHPDIFMSKVKEVDFFVKESNWKEGLDWYRENFDPGTLFRGESSQNYTKRHHFEPGVPERILQTLDDVKLIYIVRDPIDRVVSHYHEALAGGYAPNEGFNAFLSKDIGKNHYVLTSSYYYQILPYVERFGMENIHVLGLEDLKSNRLETMNEIFKFLDLEKVRNNETFDFIRNAGVEKRSSTAFGRFVFGAASERFRRVLPRGLKDRLKGSGWTKSLLTRKIKREVLEPEIADQIREVLRPDIREFRELTGREFSEWSV